MKTAYFGGGGPPPAVPVTSVFGRIGAVLALLNDYAASLIDNDSSVAGATVKDALETLAASSAADTSLTDVYWVDSDKTVSAARDGSLAKPFASMTDALAAWKANGCIGVINVVRVDTFTAFDFPAPDVNPSLLRIVGIGAQTGDLQGGRTYLGSHSGIIDLTATGLSLSLENIAIDGLNFQDAGLLTIDAHNCILGTILFPRLGIVDSYFYDSVFTGVSDYVSGFGPALPMHFHNCLMGDIDFANIGSAVFVVSPTNRPNQNFTVTWPSFDAANLAYLDGVANYLAPVLTNGTAVVMT